MTKVFISYSQTDLVFVEKLENFLIENQHKVWRDQKSVKGGQNWPKVIGEAIASNDLVLLVWTNSAKNSHFVEFEWTTAVALRKTIVPYLLDDTPLPPSLSTYNSISVRNLKKNKQKILEALQTQIPETKSNHHSAILEKLNEIEAVDPKKVVSAVKNTIEQQTSHVEGNVYQVARDIIFTQPERKKSLGKKIVFWAGIVATLVAIIVSVLSWKYNWQFNPKSARLYGDVKHENSTGVAHATIEIRSQIDSALIGSGVTGSKGAFDIPVKERWEETIYVTVILGDSIGFEGYLILTGGNKNIPFKAFKRNP